MNDFYDRPSWAQVIDVPLLRKALEHITAHPEGWNQEHWAQKTACGTAFCLAGHVAVMSGHEPLWERCGFEWSAAATTDGELIFDVARRHLGLTLHEAQDLFEGGNYLERLWELASLYTQGEITTPPGIETDERFNSSRSPAPSPPPADGE